MDPIYIFPSGSRDDDLNFLHGGSNYVHLLPER
jgi:hypothetical protein